MKNYMFKMIVIAITVIINLVLIVTVIISVKNTISTFKQKQESRIISKRTSTR